jgi:urease accessory protein
MLRIEQVIGSRAEPDIAATLHDLESRGAVDVLMLSPGDMARRRMRAQTRGGTDVAIALPRAQSLSDGAVLLLESDRALVVHTDARRWLRLTPRAITDAVELGYQAGNLRWRVRFAGESLLVALEAPAAEYLARIDPIVAERRVDAQVIEATEAP